MTPATMLRYWREAQQFKPAATRIYVIPMYTKP